MTPLDVAALKYVGSAVISDDGDHIAYTLRIQADPLKENKPAHFELHVYDVERDQNHVFVTRGSVRAVAFRPGHESITFLNRLDDAPRTILYEIPLTGGEARPLLEHATSISTYDWSADGKMLAFVAPEQKEDDAPVLPYQPEIYEGDLTYREAWMHDTDTGESTQLKVDGNVESAFWSPDGSKLVMSVSKSPLVDDHYMEQQLKIVDRQSRTVSATIDHAGKLGEFVWSPDGKQIAFIAGADHHDPIDGRLFVAPVTGGKPTPLFHDWKGMFEDIAWVDSDTINYLGSKGSESVYGLVHVPTQTMTETVTSGFAIGAFDVNRAGEFAFTAHSAISPPELYYASGPNNAVRLTTSNPWLDEVQMGRQEVVRYQARDGLEIEGVLIYPTDYEQGKRYPLIVSVHGGPESHINNGWVTSYSAPGQVAAGKGYAVFYPNYRGSTGRGLDFVLSSQGDAAGKEFDDIVDGVDHLIATGLVDKAKVGVTGGSYGGYATGWLSTKYTDRFAAGVMFVGISNKISKWGTTDIPNEEYLVHARGWVYDHYDFYLERSPIYHAGKCKTPLLIMHGKEDPRVHPSQSMEMYRHVKSRTDTPVELIFYPGEGHGNARATARYDYSLRMFGWFDQYLLGQDKT